MTLAVILISIVVIVMVSGQMVVQRLVKHDFEPHQGVVEAMLGVVGTLFSVLLGLLVANAIDNYHDVKMLVSSESNGLGDVFRLARGLDETDRTRIRPLCREYAKIVLEEEWPLMNRRETSQHAWDIYQQLWEAAVSVMPSDNRQSNLHQALLSSMQTFGENRRSRTVAVQQALPAVLWLTIALGATITIIFTYFFTAKLGKLHTVMTALIAASLGLNVWLLAAYSSPFQGELQIQPDAFRLLQNQIFQSPDTQPRFLEEGKPHKQPAK
jgi:hypothetical protein